MAKKKPEVPVKPAKVEKPIAVSHKKTVEYFMVNSSRGMAKIKMEGFCEKKTLVECTNSIYKFTEPQLKKINDFILTIL